MKYEEALAKWGEQQIRKRWYRGTLLSIDPATVLVTMKFNRGSYCCDGSDGCYCSLAEDPSASVSITADTLDGGRVYCTIDLEDFDFFTVLRELVEIADGAITA